MWKTPDAAGTGNLSALDCAQSAPPAKHPIGMRRSRFARSQKVPMLQIFESILPIFLLIVAGNLLRRLPLVDDGAWPGLEQLGFWFLYPVLLFTSIANADFSGLRIDTLFLALTGAVALMVAGILALWPLARGVFGVKHSEYSTVFQTSIRWNGFMALAIAEKLFPPEGAAVVALAMAVIVIPVNLVSISIVTRFADAAADWPTVFRRIATNPLVLAATAGLLARLLPDGIYGPFDVALHLVARAALGMGLISIGAGLMPRDILSVRPALWLPVAYKLAVAPALIVGLGLAFGLSGNALLFIALCGAVPTAMNGYVLARQLGGDAPLYAAIATLQTALSFFSIPVVLSIAAQLASG